MNTDSDTFDNEFSNLSDEEVSSIRQLEKKINEQHNPPVCLIAYDEQNENM